MSREQPWTLWAACRGHPTHIFYPDPPNDSAAAKAVCETCPVRDLCADHGLHAEAFGVWGGLDEFDRRRMRKQATRAEPAQRTLFEAAGL